MTRVLNSLLPFSPKFITMYKEKPDLYGPFWIMTTLIVLLVIIGNFARYLDIFENDEKELENFEYNFRYVPIATIVVYSVWLGFTLLLKVLLRFLGVNIFENSYVEVSCLSPHSFSIAPRNIWILVLKLHDNSRVELHSK